KSIVVMLLLVAGLSGFAVKYVGYFEKGAKSVGARLDYWKVATQIAVHHPVLGSGPGTFSVLYRYLKPPEAEMARLVHNDYLEQACDSGFVGFLIYGVFVAGSLALLRPSLSRGFDWLQLCVWLGVVGWATQSLFEFGLYVPALAWPAFLFLGWLWGSHSQQNLDDESLKPS
ncbi:MAG: O-antigen ligase family protein, partial [Verrucomicrobia bacterium]|nr:O-antigen ligase family protein [Verrucomicrobiota bacterium]